MSAKKIAIVYDWIDKWGGVERVLLALHALFPQADFYTSYYDPASASWARDLQIQTSFIQRLPSFIRKSRILSLLLYPYAFESFNFSQYDLVISVSSSFSKSVITRPETMHISYILTPTRFLWIHPELYLKRFPIIGPKIAQHLKNWDLIVSNRPDSLVAISQTVADRISEHYQRKSAVVYPPFDEHYWKQVKSKVQSLQTNLPGTVQDSPYYLVVSRLEPYKNVDMVIRLFNVLKDKKLIIVGTGTQENKLKKIARKNIQFVNNISDIELAEYYSHAIALIMPQEEDFGYVALEAQYFGCPVIAYGKGGALETVLKDKTGIIFGNQTEFSLRQALETYDKISYNLRQSLSETTKNHIEQFSLENFNRKIMQIINNSLKNI